MPGKTRQPYINGALGSDIRAELNGMLPFSLTATLTAIGAATPVHILPAASVPVGMKAYITDVLLQVSGATPWSGGTLSKVLIQDTAAVAVEAAEVAVADLTANAKYGLASTALVLKAPIATGVGLTSAKGIDIVGDHAAGAGSDIIVTVTGYMAA